MGGGYDLELDREGTVPLFLQFKLADCMTRRTCREFRSGRLPLPCYRMHLRPKRFSRQHELLCDLQDRGEEVFYVAPAFHQPTELNIAYRNGQIRQRSLWLKPKDIGALPDSKDHHVSFRLPALWHLFSDPVEFKAPIDFEAFDEHMWRRVRAQSRTPLRELLPRIAENVSSVADMREYIEESEKAALREIMVDRPLLSTIAHYASVILECRLLLIGPSPESAAV